MAQAQNLRGPADLHTHSSISDGTETPTQLIAAAAEAGLGTVALTDHDSTAGWFEASAAARNHAITLIPGMEFSTRYKGRSMHILAYLFDPGNGDLASETARIRESRLTRAAAIVDKLAADYTLTWDDVVAQTTPGATVGRPHIADALVARGHVPTRSEAFAGILHPRTGYFVPHYAPAPLEAVELVRAAGGVTVIAHPATSGRSAIIDEKYLSQLVDAGLFGLEVDHRENTENGKVRLRELAHSLGLRLTGSSDYHGQGKPNRLGENTTELTVVAELIRQTTGTDVIYG